MRITAALLLQTPLAWTDPKFTIFQVSSLKKEANGSSHPSVSDKENTRSIQNISGCCVPPPQATEKKHKISL